MEVVHEFRHEIREMGKKNKVCQLCTKKYNLEVCAKSDWKALEIRRMKLAFEKISEVVDLGIEINEKKFKCFVKGRENEEAKTERETMEVNGNKEDGMREKWFVTPFDMSEMLKRAETEKERIAVHLAVIQFQFSLRIDNLVKIRVKEVTIDENEQTVKIFFPRTKVDKSGSSKTRICTCSLVQQRHRKNLPDRVNKGSKRAEKRPFNSSTDLNGSNRI